MAMPMGDRRWAPTRKSGMTVLGKVPKGPKPINLPSQRLENHGLDPNVEIVPKGPHTWGNRPPSTNAWGSTSLLSPKADGSSTSPSHVNDRPSSGGSTRPSTAGSDRPHEPAFSARGPNSRPSSASGALTSNQTLTTATRPRSADTRPSSSQLSRFAESPVGVSGTVDRGPASSKTNNFSLSSGDFPILGADKNPELQVQRGHSFHGRPGSASGSASAPKEAPRPLSSGDKNANTYPDRGNVNTWKADDYHPIGGGPSPNMTWQSDPQQAEPYPAANIPPQQFGPWSDAVWHSDGAVGDQYRPPGSYPVDRNLYYPHQFPVRLPPNLDPFPRPGSDPCGYNPKNGDSYHHHQPPDAHMVPGHYPSFPVRPGVYPNSWPCDGTFSISNEQELSVMGKCNPSAVYDQRLSQSINFVPGKFHASPSANISVMSREQKDSQLHHETHTGQYKVLLKQHDVREGKNNAQEKREQSDVSDPPQLDRGIPPFAAAHEEDWRRNKRSDERAVILKSVPCKEASSQPSSDGKYNSSDSIVTNLLESPSRETCDGSTRKPKCAGSPVQDHHQTNAMKKTTFLTEKIDGLNSKAKIADGHGGQEEEKKYFKVVNKVNHFLKVLPVINVISTGPDTTSDAVTSVSHKLDVSTENINKKSYREETVIVRPSELHASKKDSMEVGEEDRRIHVTRGRVDQHVRANSHDNDGSMKKFIGRDSISHEVRLIDCHPSQGSKEESHHAASSDDLSYVPSSLDSTDRKSERAKLKERALQRAKELQLQEEDRIKEQIAKSLAKLEELNKRTSVQSSNNRAHDIPPNNDVQPIECSAGSVGEAYTVTIEAPGPSLAQGSDSSLQASECEIKNPAGSSDSFVAMDPQIPTSGTQDSATLCEPSLLVGQESGRAEVTCMSPDIHYSSVTKNQAGSRRPNLSQDESQSNKPKSSEGLGIPNNIDLSVSRLSTDVLPGVMETSVPQRKKNNRNARNKFKPEPDIANSTVPSTAALEDVQPQDDGQIFASVAEATLVSIQSSNESTVNQVSITSSNQGQLQPTEKIHGRVSNQLRPQTSRNPSKYQLHGSRSVVWAPVKPSNKNEPSEELNQSSPDARNHSSGKNGSESDPQHVTKIKRADMEMYVPKPVVKEMPQQDSCQEPSSSLDQPGADMVEKPDLGPKISESPGTDAKIGGSNTPSRSAKVRASWRQRGAAELPSALQGSNEVIVPSYHTKPVMEPSDQKKPPSEQQLLYDDWGSGYDNPLPTEKSTKPINHGVVMQKVEGSNYAHSVNKDLQKGEQSPALGLNESDQRNPLRSKNQSSSVGGGEQLKSRWQPKYQAYPDNIRNENMGHEGQRFASRGSSFCKDTRPQPIENEEPIQGKGDTKWQKAGPQDNREYRAIVDQTKEKGHSAGKDLLTDAELSVTNSNSQQEQPPILQGHRDHLSNKGTHHANLGGGRNLGNSHFEYHKVGLYNRARYSDRQNPVIGEETQEGSSRASGLRYKERGPNYSKQGGHFYGQRAI